MRSLADQISSDSGRTVCISTRRTATGTNRATAASLLSGPHWQFFRAAKWSVDRLVALVVEPDERTDKVMDGWMSERVDKWRVVESGLLR